MPPVTGMTPTTAATSKNPNLMATLSCPTHLNIPGITQNTTQVITLLSPSLTRPGFNTPLPPLARAETPPSMITWLLFLFLWHPVPTIGSQPLYNHPRSPTSAPQHRKTLRHSPPTQFSPDNIPPPFRTYTTQQSLSSNHSNQGQPPSITDTFQQQTLQGSSPAGLHPTKQPAFFPSGTNNRKTLLSSHPLMPGCPGPPGNSTIQTSSILKSHRIPLSLHHAQTHTFPPPNQESRVTFSTSPPLTQEFQVPGPLKAYQYQSSKKQPKANTSQFGNRATEYFAHSSHHPFSRTTHQTPISGSTPPMQTNYHQALTRPLSPLSNTSPRNAIAKTIRLLRTNDHISASLQNPALLQITKQKTDKTSSNHQSIQQQGLCKPTQKLTPVIPTPKISRAATLTSPRPPHSKSHVITVREGHPQHTPIQIDQYLGDTPEIKFPNTYRFGFNNYNGINLSSQALQFLLSTTQNLQLNRLGLAETHIDSNKPHG